MVKFNRCQHFSILQWNISTEIAIAQEEKKEKKTWQETVPKEFHAFEKVFTKESLMHYQNTGHGITRSI
jgi:hypothetical protein